MIGSPVLYSKPVWNIQNISMCNSWYNLRLWYGSFWMYCFKHAFNKITCFWQLHFFRTCMDYLSMDLKLCFKKKYLSYCQPFMGYTCKRWWLSLLSVYTLFFLLGHSNMHFACAFCTLRRKCIFPVNYFSKYSLFVIMDGVVLNKTWDEASGRFWNYMLIFVKFCVINKPLFKPHTFQMAISDILINAILTVCCTQKRICTTYII